MIRSFILYRLNKQEQRLGVSLDYLRHILRVSLVAFLKFVKIMPLATYRAKLPVDAYYVARLVATRHEDCGDCLTIETNRAKSEGVLDKTIECALEGNVDDLGEPLADVVRFTEAVIQATSDAAPLRKRVLLTYGEEGLIELALAISSCRVFATTKRVLGYAEHCAAARLPRTPRRDRG